MPKKKRTGRPSLLTPVRVARMTKAIRTAGFTLEDAARSAGVSLRTFHGWRNRGELAAAVLPEGDAWTVATTAQLRDWFEELDFDVGRIPCKRLTRALLLEEMRVSFVAYRDFLEAVELAYLEGELDTAGDLRNVGRGYVVGEYGREPIVVETRSYDAEGKLVTRTEREVGPNAATLQFIMERRYDRWRRRKAEAGPSGDPASLARDIQRFLAETRELADT